MAREEFSTNRFRSVQSIQWYVFFVWKHSVRSPQHKKKPMMESFWGRKTWSSVFSFWQSSDMISSHTNIIFGKRLKSILHCSNMHGNNLCNECMKSIPFVSFVVVGADLLLMRLLLFHRWVFFSVVVLFFLLLCPSVSLCLVSIPITNGSFTIAWQMRYWQFDDCSFMSRSMWYVTKRSYLTFYSNEMKIGFSLIFTCCVQSHVKYHWLQLFRHQIKLPIITDAEAFQSDFQFIRW